MALVVVVCEVAARADYRTVDCSYGNCSTSRLEVWRQHSSLPLVWGWNGAASMCLMPTCPGSPLSCRAFMSPAHEPKSIPPVACTAKQAAQIEDSTCAILRGPLSVNSHVSI